MGAGADPKKIRGGFWNFFLKKLRRLKKNSKKGVPSKSPCLGVPRGGSGVFKLVFQEDCNNFFKVFLDS